MFNCFVSFPLVSWVICGTLLYRILIFAAFLTLLTSSLIGSKALFTFFPIFDSKKPSAYKSIQEKINSNHQIKAKYNTSIFDKKPIYKCLLLRACDDPENIVRQFFFSFFFFFLSDEGKRRMHIMLKAGHHQPTSETPLKWRFASRQMIA